jgi:rod shape-determining protein MreC
MSSFDDEVTGARRRREVWVSLSCILMASALNVLPLPAQQWISTALRASVLSPFILTQDSLRQARVRAAEISELQARLDSTIAVLASQEPLREENTRLRDLLELRERAGPAFVSASALRPGTRGSESMFLLDVGSEDGVGVNDPVVVAEGLVGIIREVGPRTSLAMDWTHPDFRVSVMTLDGEHYGIVEPRAGAFREEDRLLLNGIPFHTPLEEGAEVVTSGRGTVYPRGVRIGTVLSLAEAEAGWRRAYWIEPAVRPASVTHALVITGEEGRPVSELTHLWYEPEEELEEPEPGEEESEPGEEEPDEQPEPGEEPEPGPAEEGGSSGDAGDGAPAGGATPEPGQP